jgi:hypothetical protein
MRIRERGEEVEELRWEIKKVEYEERLVGKI